MLINGVNITQDYQDITTLQAQDNDANVFAAALMYLFALICTQKDTCSDVFEIFCSLALTVGSVLIARMPVKALRYRVPEEDIAKVSMVALWTMSVIGGGYAANIEYSHYLRDTYEPDGVDKFNAVASAALSGAMVTTIFSTASAGLVHVSTPTIANMYNRAKNACRRNNENTSYRLLEEGEHREDQASHKPSRCRRICGG